MRSILIIFATIVLVAIGFFAYLWFQSGSNGPAMQETAPVAMTPASRPTELPDPDRINGAGNGQNAWMRNIDEKTGLVSNEFRASKYEPRKDGTIDVTDPEAKFFLGNSEPRQMLVVRGKHGKVFVPDSGNTKNSNAGFGSKGSGTETPSHGNLKDVTLLLYDTPTSPEPNLVCTMDNASFDQETFRVYTDSFERNGKMVAADEVPVQVRGVDYDFDGRGLDLRWNERDRRLQQLEIAHGERLVIKHPNALQQKQQGGNGGGNGGAANKPTPPTSFHSGFNLLPMLASADPAAAAMLIADATTPEPPTRRLHHTPAASEPAVAPVKIVRDKNAPIFRATFFDNVRIVQGDEQLATAKLMHIDFLMENSSTTKPTTAPTAETPPAQPAKSSNNTEPKSISAAKKKSATQPAVSPQQQASAQNPPPTTAPSERHRNRHDGAPAAANTNQPNQQSVAAPTSQPDEPVTIYWTGKLDVTPLDAAMPDPPTKGDSIVTLLGEPVTLTHTGSRVDAASVRYRTGNSSVLMENSDTVPQVVMHDVNGSIIHTPSLQYDGESNVAILRGASQADLVTQAPSTQPTTQPAEATTAQNTPQNPPPMMHATWTRTCRLFMIGDPKSSMNIDRAEIDGDVTIDHPQIKGKSDSLELGFEQIPTTQPAAQSVVQPAAQQPETAAPTTQPTMQSNLKNLLANGNVHYVMISQSDGKTQTIDTSRLTLETARDDQGRTYARTINAQGGVHTYSDTQDLKCGTLALKLMPSTQPTDADQQQQQDNGQMNTASTQLESMTADQDVRATSVNGNTASCDRLTMDTKDGLREIVLVGQPMAHVKQKEDTLNGPIIRIDPDSNRAYVVGAGTMHAIQQSASGKPQPIDVSWSGNLDANGDTNVVNINDHVAIHSISSDGSIDDATSDRLKMILMDDPRASTQPSTQPDTSSPQNSPMGQAGFGNTNFFKNKIVQTIYLNDNVVVKSVLNDAKGNLARRMRLECQVLQYDVQTKTMIIPVPGAMLMQDLGKPPAGQSGEQPLGDMSGATAFKWTHEMRYVDAEHHMSMTGDVYVNHQSGGNSQPFTLNAQQLTADLEPIPTTQESDQSAATEAATAPATTQTASTKPSGEGKMRLSHVTATDQVQFVSHPMHFDASSIDYDPNTHEMIAKASDRVRAEMYDDKGEVASSFMELHYNTQTGQSSSTDLRANIAKQP